MSKLISTHQSAFIPERAMMDGVLAINEIIDFGGNKSRGCLLVKVNSTTTYDCVAWDYLKYVLGRMNFGSRWLKWM
ncbi:unnamed protein product [Lathyrus sativus]|nr:unnamed protein product [Lathyrus sativus]